jgi:hypothetical protein
MAEETSVELSQTAQKTRRAFVKTAAQVAVTAPAVSLLLSATTKPAAAATCYSVKGCLGDDTAITDNPALGNPDTFPTGGGGNSGADDLHGVSDDFGNPPGFGTH